MINLWAVNYFHPGITLLGAGAFILFLAWELASLHGSGRVVTSVFKGLSIIVGTAAHILILTGPRFPRGLETTLVGAAIICLTGYLLYRSLVAELPGETYSYLYATGKSAWRKTCRQGTYALVRHPALWWYGLFLAGLFILSGAKWMLVSGVVWWIANLVLVVVEDLYIYPRMFEDYGDYKRKTPMLIPDRLGFFRCLKTWPRQK